MIMIIHNYMTWRPNKLVGPEDSEETKIDQKQLGQEAWGQGQYNLISVALVETPFILLAVLFLNIHSNCRLASTK